MKQCANGHIYDEELRNGCPYCSNGGNIEIRPLDYNAAQPAFAATEPFNVPNAVASPTFPKTEPLNAPVAAPKPAAAPTPTPAVKKEMDVTVALNVSDSGINPVRGWLVVVNGDKVSRYAASAAQEIFTALSAKPVHIRFTNAINQISRTVSQSYASGGATLSAVY